MWQQAVGYYIEFGGFVNTNCGIGYIGGRVISHCQWYVSHCIKIIAELRLEYKIAQLEISGFAHLQSWLFCDEIIAKKNSEQI